MATFPEYNRLSFVTAKTQILKLWQETFGDDKKFIETFFEIFDVNTALHTLSVNEELISMLFALPCELQHKGTRVKLAYIYAVATRAEHRGNGYMQTLMRHTHDSLLTNGYSAAILLPADKKLRDYYGKMGYEPCAWRKYETHRVIEIKSNCDIATYTAFDHDLYNFIKSRLLLRNNIIHSCNLIEMNIIDAHTSGGNVYAAFHNGRLCAVAFVALRKDKPLITEFIYDDITAKNDIIRHICSGYSVSSVESIVSHDTGEPFAMMLRFDNSLPKHINMQLMLDV